eukprot:116727_1
MDDVKEVAPNVQDTLIGKLYKKGKINKAWKPRYFIGSRSLQSIRYYQKESDLNEDKNEKGRIDLITISRIETNASSIGVGGLPQYIAYNPKLKSNKRYTFHLISAPRTYVLATDSASQLMKWFNFLQSCLYGAEVIMSGYLNVQERKQKGFNSRYFVLNSLQQLKSYDNEHLEHGLGAIDCKQITKIDDDQISTDTVSIGYVLDIHIDSHKWTVAAKSQQERSEWVRCIQMMQNDRWQYKLSKQKSLQINKQPKQDEDTKEDGFEPFKINKRPMYDDSGYLERQKATKDDDHSETRESYCTRNEAAMNQWFGPDQLKTNCDETKPKEDEKEKDFRDCYAVNRLAMVMASAKEDMQTTFDVFCQKEVDADGIYSITTLINDYHHLLEEHDVELEDIRQFLIDKHGLNCSKSQCDYLSRNYRNRAMYDDSELYKTEDAKRMLMNKQLDKMHAYLLHSFDLNYRLTKNEGLRIFGAKTEQKDDKKSDADDDEDGEHDDEVDVEDAHEGQAIEQMQKVIERKRIKIRQLVGEEQMTNNKFVTKVVSEKSDEKQSVTQYSFGFPFKYYQRFRHDKWFIRNKHTDLKHELLDNPFHKLCNSLWENQWEAANAFLQCNRIKSLGCSHIARYSEPQPKDTGIKDGSPITAPHVLSLLLYCNFTELCTVFSSAFRRISEAETDEEVKERNAHFFHWSRLLFEAIHLFGTLIAYHEFGKCAYHGVSRVMVFDSMNQYVYGPFSTTSQFNVALNFACDTGLVVTLNRSSSTRYNKYFDCAFLSDFSAEAEKLFLNGLLQISDILHVQSRMSFGKYCRALNVLTSMLSGTPLIARIARKKHAAFYLTMMKDGHEPYPDYVEALWLHAVQHIKRVDIDVQLLKVVEVDVKTRFDWLTNKKEGHKWGFKVLNSFLMLENGWINLERLCILLPNLEVVEIERYKRDGLGRRDKVMETMPLNEQLIDRFLEYQPLFPIQIIIRKPNESEMSMSSFVAKCRETQKGKMNKAFVVESGTIGLSVCFGDTPLHQACTNGEDELVLQLLKRDDEAVKASINKPAHYTKSTPLFIAVDQGHVKCVAHMLSLDDVSLNVLDRRNNSMFMMAVAHCDNDIALMLLDHSDKMKKEGTKHGIVDINHVDDDGDSALHLAATNNNHQIIDALIQRNINTDLQNSRHETALHIACEEQHTQTVEILLKTGKANADILNVLGKTPLMDAINERYTQGIELLLKYGANTNTQNEHDDDNVSATALYYAIKKKSKNTVSLLLDAGADPTFIDANGQTYLHVAAEEAQIETLKMLFETVSGSERMTKEELIAFVNQKDTDGDTVLHIVSDQLECNSKDCVEFLLQKTACDVNILNNEGRPALSTALKSGFNQIAQMLLAAGAKTDIINKSSKTLLFDAVESRYIDLVKAVYDNYLKNSNVEEATRFVNHVDNEGKTAVFAAFNAECVDYLIEVGAKIDVYDNDGGSLLHANAREDIYSCEVMETIYHQITSLRMKRRKSLTGTEWMQSGCIVTNPPLMDEDKVKAFINHADNKHETALFACANDVKLAKYLVSIGGKIDSRCDINKVNEHKNTALSNAATEGCLELVNILMDAGAKIDTFNKNNETPLYRAAEAHACDVLKAIYNRYLQNTDYAAATKFVNHKNNKQKTALFAPVWDPDCSGIDCVAFLLSVGAEVCLFDNEGKTPLISASESGDAESLKVIYNHYLKTTDLATATRLVNHKDKKKKSALFHAAPDGYTECIQFLLSVGAHTDPSDLDKEGNSLLHQCAQGESVESMKVIYEHIVQNINENEAKEFVNLRNRYGQTAVLVAAREFGKKDLIEYLYSIGAALDVFEGVRGKSVLHYLYDSDVLQTVYELYLKDTNLFQATQLINAQNFNNETVLHLAVSWTNALNNETVKYLLENTFCDVNLENNNSETPLMIAAKEGSTEIVKLLLTANDVKLVDNHDNCEALRLAKRKKKECADAIEESLMQQLPTDKATQIIKKYPDNYPEHDDPEDCLIM